MSRHDDLEKRIDEVIRRLETDFADLGQERRWAITRALIHRAVHHGTSGDAVEYCTIATYLGEMIGHSHKLAHGENPQASSHKGFVH